MNSIPTQRHTRSTPDGAGERVDLPITGMTCAACARRVESGLARAPGVRRATVNFANSRATVEYDPTHTAVKDLIEVVKQAGYNIAGTARADFVVDDSARPSDSSRPLESHLGRTKGVAAATFNLATMQVRIDYLPSVVTIADLRRAIEAFGYRVREMPAATDDASPADSEAAARDAEYREIRAKFWIAAGLSLPVLVIAMSHGGGALFNRPWINWLQLALTTPVVLYSGAHFYRGAWAAFRHRAADMNTLIAIGTGAAYLYS